MRIGRALQLDEIVNYRNKVTLGFKCSPQLKIGLAMEAERFSMSLSEYVESLVENRNAQIKTHSKFKLTIEVPKFGNLTLKLKN